MPIKVEPFINPFRRVDTNTGMVVDIVTVNGKTYKKLVVKNGK